MTRLFISLLLLCIYFPLASQSATSGPLKPRIGVLNIDTKGFVLDPIQMGNLVRLELDKLNLFEVLDKYDVAYLAEKEGLKFENCYGKICLVETGKKLRSDKMLTGSIELLGEHIVISLRLIDVGTETVEKSQVMEFLNIRNAQQQMVNITLQQMFGLATDADLVKKLTKPDDYASAINVPDMAKLNLSGPRMGMTFFTGELAKRLEAPRNEGGMEARPVMFQFGYQFETTYLNQGKLQALFEFLPIITGLDQSQFIPSFTILHGVRSNRSGFEFAFGPTIVLSKEAEGFYGDNGRWILLSDWLTANPGQPKPSQTTFRVDERGTTNARSAFVFAFGKSFKSGKMNIPVNAFYIPDKNGHRFGISVGFNGRG
jgi:hypothetical protein